MPKTNLFGQYESAINIKKGPVGAFKNDIIENAIDL